MACPCDLGHPEACDVHDDDFGMSSDSPVGGGVTGPDPRTLTVYVCPECDYTATTIGNGVCPWWSKHTQDPKHANRALESITLVEAGSERARVIEELRAKARQPSKIGPLGDLAAGALDAVADWLARGLDGESE